MKNAVLWYVLAKLLVVVASFASLPVFSRLLSTDQYGDYALFLSWVALLTPVFGLALHSSISRAFFEFKGDIDYYFSNILFLSLLCVSFFSILIFSLDLLFGRFPKDYFVLIIVVTILSKVFTSCSLELFRFKDRYRVAAIITMLLPLLAIAVSYLLITSSISLDAAIKRILGMASAELFVALLCLFLSVSRAPTLKASHMQFAFRYSLPLVVGSTSIVLVGQLDKLVISQFLGQSELGIYAFYGTLASMIYVFSGAVNQAIMPWVYKKLDAKEYLEVELLYRRLLLLLWLLCLVLITLSEELLILMGPPEYRKYKEVLQVLFFANFLQVCVMVEMVLLYFEKRTAWISIIMLVSAASIFYLNYAFLSGNGIQLSAWVLVSVNILSVFALIVLNISILRRAVVEFKVYFLLFLASLGLIALFYGNLIPDTYRYGFALVLIIIGIILSVFYARHSKKTVLINSVAHRC